MIPVKFESNSENGFFYTKSTISHSAWDHIVYNRGEQLFSSAGHIAPLIVSRGPHFSQKGKVKAKKNSLRGPERTSGPHVAPSLSISMLLFLYFLHKPIFLLFHYYTVCKRL